MNAKQFSEALSQIDGKYVEEALNYKKKAKKAGWINWGAMAACLLLIAGSLLALPGTHSDSRAMIGQLVDDALSFTASHDGRRVINKYNADSAGSYATPSPGEVTFTSQVRAAREKYAGKDVVFLLSFDIFKDDGRQITELSEEEQIAEYQRLIAAGYQLYLAECWTYQGEGERRYYTVVVGYFTESELSLFKGNPEYGYMFDFVTNGDGSGISVDEADMITGIPTNHS